MSTEKRLQLPNTDQVFREFAAALHGVEQLAGTVLLDRYRLVELRGSGGAAVVYRAEHTLMHKAVAVKILRPDLAVRPDFVRRFLAEARIVARLRHENIVDIVDLGRTETGIVFCVMELLDGEELAATMERDGPMPWDRARHIIVQVCRALAAAHAAGVVHRDIKPQNCFRIRHGDNHDFIKLLDFGIAKRTDTDQGLTATGVIMGTAEYMSPEQARGSDVDARADIYSVGAMLFEMLAGRPPFEGASFIDVLVKHASAPPPRLASLVPGIEPAIDALIARTLAKRPEDRFASAAEFMTALVASDTRTFQGRLDGAQLDARPESMLPPRGQWSRMTAASGARSWRTVAVLALVGLVFVASAVALATRRWENDEPPPASEEQDSPVAAALENPGSDAPMPAPAIDDEPERQPASASTEHPAIVAAPEEAPLQIPEEETSESTRDDPAAAKAKPASRVKRRSSTPSLPLILSSAEINAGVAPLLARAQACGALHGKARLWKAGVSITIDGFTGSVTSATALYPDTGTPFGKCVQAVLKSATFKKFQQASMTEKIYLTM